MLDTIGVDESGKGDYFGPLVVAACFVTQADAQALSEVTDSKKLSDVKAMALASEIKTLCPYEILVIMPKRYNEVYADIKNLNRLLEWAHAKVIESLSHRVASQLIVSDQFANPRGLQEKLNRKGITTKLESVVRAESSHLAVAAASVLARAEFLHRMRQLSNEFDIPLPKGATAVIGPARTFIAKHGRAKLNEVAKLHFKTTGQL